MKDFVEIKLKTLRLKQIYNIVSGELPISCGLAIEKECLYSNNYYVIAFMRYVEYENYVALEVVDDRILDLDDNEFPIFKKLCKTAKDIISEVNRKEE